MRVIRQMFYEPGPEEDFGSGVIKSWQSPVQQSRINHFFLLQPSSVFAKFLFLSVCLSVVGLV